MFPNYFIFAPLQFLSGAFTQDLEYKPTQVTRAHSENPRTMPWRTRGAVPKPYKDEDKIRTERNDYHISNLGIRILLPLLNCHFSECNQIIV